MSKTVEQIYATNPTTVVADTDLYYLVQSPYTPGSDAAITGASLKSAFGAGGTINPGLINELAWYASSGTTLSGLATLFNGTLVTSAAGVPSISQTLPSAVQGNITSLGTISSGTWNGSIIGGTYGGTGINNGASTITIGGNVTFSGAFTFTGTLTGNTGVTFPTSGTLATTSQLPTPSALTRTDDTNVTLTLGGSPTVALLAATSLTLGWTGTLAETRGGTAQSTYALGDTLYASAANTLSKLAGNITTTKQYLSQTGNGAVSAAPAWATIAGSDITGAALTKTDDTNVTLTLGGTPTTALLRAASLTLGWTGQLGLTRGGTNASLTASNGGIVWSNASQLQILSGTATANQILLSGATATPAWSTTTYPSTNAINTIMYASSANVLGVITPANSSVLVSSSGGVPSWSTALPSSLTATNMTLTTPTLGAATATSIAFSPTTGGIIGTTTNDNTGAGKVGEFVSSVIVQASAVSLTNTVPANITSISLTAGDWDVWGNVGVLGAAGTTLSDMLAWISSTSATRPDASLRTDFNLGGGITLGTGNLGSPVPELRFSLSGTTTIYLSCQGNFGISTLTGYGGIYARRVR